jgi:periplasmic protein CpxP/Spy
MKRTIVTLATFLAAAGIANAQTTSPSTPSTTMPPSGGSSTTMPSSGAAGAMSATAVKSKIEASGYSNVTNLKQDASGGWTAKASKGSQQVAVSVDSKGMVKEAQQ